MSRILVVEDEPAIAELISINLRHAGFEVTVATDADEAQDAVDGALPALVVLDWMLPGRSGYVLVRQWRAVPRTRGLPVIMLTARSEEADKVSGLDAGADDYLTKPFSANELLARIRATRARAVVVDLTGVPAFEPSVAMPLVQAVESARLMGARTIVTGLSADIAAALVAQELDLSAITVAGDLQAGIEVAVGLLD